MMEYGSIEIKEKLESRKKFVREIRRKIEEVKEYSMKIIEVILNDDESDEEEEEDILVKKKQYETLKADLARIRAQESEMQHRLESNTERLKSDIIHSVNKAVVGISVSVQTEK